MELNWIESVFSANGEHRVRNFIFMWLISTGKWGFCAISATNVLQIAQISQNNYAILIASANRSTNVNDVYKLYKIQAMSDSKSAKLSPQIQMSIFFFLLLLHKCNEFCWPVQKWNGNAQQHRHQCICNLDCVWQFEHNNVAITSSHRYVPHCASWNVSSYVCECGCECVCIRLIIVSDVTLSAAIYSNAWNELNGICHFHANTH